MEEKILTVSFCRFCYSSPVSCNSNVASSRNYIEKLACFQKFFKLCFVEQVMFYNNRKKKKRIGK